MRFLMAEAHVGGDIRNISEDQVERAVNIGEPITLSEFYVGAWLTWATIGHFYEVFIDVHREHVHV